MTAVHQSPLSRRRVLVTGGAGFLGRVLCRQLGEGGVEDLVVPRRRDHDLTEQEAVRDLLRSTKPDVVFHLAAEVGGIGANRKNPGRYFYANMAMGLNLIEASREIGVSKFVQVGTVCAYPKHTRVPFSEDDLWTGYPEETNAPYGIAKKSLLVMLQAYREQYGFPGIYLLPANLYGPGDNFDPETSHVVPALIRKFVEAKALRAESVTLWGTGTPSREFLYVEDAAKALVLAAERYEGSAPVNVGTGVEVTIADLARLIADLVGFGGLIEFDRERPDGQPRRSLDISRAMESFGFAPSTDIEDGLRQTISWWESHNG